MDDLSKHIIISINRDSETLFSHGGLTRHNLLLIQSILQDPTRDYTLNDAPPYTLQKHASDVSMSDKPFLPPRSLTGHPRSVSQRQDSPPQYHKETMKPPRPPPPASKPVSNDKLSNQYKSEKQEKQESASGNRGEQFKNQVAQSAASGLGWGVGVNVAGRLI